MTNDSNIRTNTPFPGVYGVSTPSIQRLTRKGYSMRPIPGTITDPAATRGLFDEAPSAPPENLVRLSRRECAWLIEAALRHADRQGTPEFAPAIIEKLWACFKG